MRKNEKGTALLSVLLLVAVMAAISATALDRLGLATRLAGNAAQAGQARHWLGMAEEIAMARLEVEAADAGAALGAILDVERTIELPDGMTVRATLSDASNCFNLNSLVRERRGGRLSSNPRAIEQFVSLMTLSGASEARARNIAESAADYIDTDQRPNLRGAESGVEAGDIGTASFPNRAMVSVHELARIEGIDRELFGEIEPFLCANPNHELSRLNVETLRPDQAVLIAMLDPEQISIDQAASHLAARPRGGYGSVYDFWNGGALRGVSIARQASEQVQVESRFFRLDSVIDTDGPSVRQRALIALDDGSARRLSRSWSGR